MVSITLRSSKGSPLTNNEVDSNFSSLNTFKVEQTASAGSAVIPSGGTASRDASPSAGYLRYNTDDNRFEGYTGSSWGVIGGGITSLTYDSSTGVIKLITEIDSYPTTINLSPFTTSNLAEGNNLYYTTARFDSDFGNNTTSDLTEGSNLYYTTARADSDFDIRLATKTTTSLTEGDNLYYTTARADSDFDVRLATKTTTSLTEGDNLYYTTARADSDFDIRLATKTTDNLTEGSNLYYTTVRVDSDIDARVNKTFIDALNVDADTLDGVSSESFLRSDAADIKTSGNLTFNDNVALKIGTDADLDISHDGNDTYITNGNGVLYVQGNTVSITNQAGTGTMGYFTNAGAARLYYNNVERLRTSDSGSTVTGNLTVTGSFSDITTDGLTEGSTNLYYTSARADSDAKHAFSVTDNGGDGSLSYDNSTGIITYTGPSAAEVRAHISAGTGVSITDGQISIGQAVATSSNVQFATVTTTGGKLVHDIASSVNVDSAGAAPIDSTAHGSGVISIEYLVQAYDGTAGASQVSKVLVTFDTTSVATSEYGLVHTGDSDLGSFSARVNGSAVDLMFTRRPSNTIAIKATKTVIT